MNQRALKFQQNRKDPLSGLTTQEKCVVTKQLGKNKVAAPKQDDESSDGLDFGDEEPVDFKKKRPLTDISSNTNQSKVVEMMLKRRKV